MLCLAGLLTWVPSAGAHASLQGSSPAANERLEAAPSQVELRFDEAVSVADSGIRVFDATAKRVDTGSVTIAGSRASIALAALDGGAYVVVWKAVSSDGHPIAGSFTFQVGEGDQRALASFGERELAAATSSPFLRALTRVARGFLFAPLMLMMATAAWLLVGLPLPGGRWIRVTSICAALGALSYLLIDGPYVQGRSLSAAFDPSLVGDTLGRLTGRAIAPLMILPLMLGQGLIKMRDGRLSAKASGTARFTTARVELVGFLVILSMLLAASGHGAAGEYVMVALPLTALHIAAVSIWAAGIALLVISFGRPTWTNLHSLTWSRLATGSVAAMVVSGMFASWRQVGSLDALRSTRYGSLLIAKLAVVASMLVLAAVHRRTLMASTAASDGASTPWKRSSLAAEALGGVIVLGFTAVLSSAIPARADLVRPISLRLPMTTTRTDVTISPARSGPNVAHLYVFGPNGLPTAIVDAHLTFTHLATGTIVEVDPTIAGKGHREARVVVLPFRGTWSVNTKVYVTEFSVESAQATFTIR
jgi:copper transport protein